MRLPRPDPLLFLALTPLVLIGCTPTVKLEAPDKPIEINLNVKIEQEVRVKVEKELEKDIAANPDLFGIPSAPASKGKSK